MSNQRGLIIIHAAQGELRLVRAHMDDYTVVVSAPHIFAAPGVESNDEATPLCDEAALDGVASVVARNGWFGDDLVCLVSGSSVSCQYHDLPPLKHRELDQAVRLKLAQQLHFDVADACIAVDPLGSVAADDGEQAAVRVGVTACHRDWIDAAIAAAERVGLKLVSILAAPVTLTALARDTVEREDGLHAFLCVDDVSSTLIVLDGTMPVVTSELPIGAADLTAALMRPIIAGDDVLQLDEAKATKLRDEIGIPEPDQMIESLGVSGDRVLPLIEPVLQKMVAQLTQWLTFASTSANRRKIEWLRVVGAGSQIPGLAKTIGARTSTDAIAFDWLSNTRLVGTAWDEISVQRFAAAIGAARHWRNRPDLLPAFVRRRRQVHAARRAVSFAGPAATAALLGFALLFGRIDARLRPWDTTLKQQLSSIQLLFAKVMSWRDTRAVSSKIERRFEKFVEMKPTWVGFFKELSHVLPPEFHAERLDVLAKDGRLTVTINGFVDATQDKIPYDKIATDTLKRLNKSPFCHEVNLMNASRGDSQYEGTVSFQIALAYPLLDSST